MKIISQKMSKALRLFSSALEEMEHLQGESFFSAFNDLKKFAYRQICKEDVRLLEEIFTSDDLAKHFFQKFALKLPENLPEDNMKELLMNISLEAYMILSQNSIIFKTNYLREYCWLIDAYDALENALKDIPNITNNEKI